MRAPDPRSIDSYNERLARLSAADALPLLGAINRGVERETLRVTQEGGLAQTPHPEHLGSKLCHPSITTDYSESQLELITPVAQDVGEMLERLDEIHRFVYAGLDTELLWPASMPCRLLEDAAIPLAYYGNSNPGRLKHLYRKGLAWRYGRTMQTICAVHYNFSLPDALWALLWREHGGREDIREFRSRRYFDLMRNFRRFSWLPVYLFGASPVAHDSFVRHRAHTLQRLDGENFYGALATSLRNGNLGYQSDVQSEAINICYNGLDNYVDTLVEAILTPHPPYEKIGAQRNGEYLQVSTALLQAEAEFYTTIRAKCIPPPGRNFLKELKRGGVAYIEVRLLDLNPYLPLGIDENEVRFLDTLLLYCLLMDSPEHGDELCYSVRENMLAAVCGGRDPALLLNDQGNWRTILEWGGDLLRSLRPVAGLLDRAIGKPVHAESLALQQTRMADPEAALSGRLLADLRAARQSFVEFGLGQAAAHRRDFRSRPLPAERLEAFRELTRKSREDQARLETEDTQDFDTFLAAKLREYRELAEESGSPE
ncbi:MAG TPA: glutamate--cysteine ligase [Gammaproteobacteria bacterium]|nr:glutamate--cysteine ligase [Gammaproteobacteria bacterium]